MSNSKLIRSTILSPHNSGRRTEKITKIPIHIMAGNLSAENCGRWFQNPKAVSSSQYGIGTDGGICLYVDESNRAWTTSSEWCDQRAVTIEVANDSGAPNWHVSDKAYQALLNLVEDICRRNGIKECTYTGDSNGTLIKHSWFANKSCPGPYLGGKFPDIAKEVTRRLRAVQPTEPTPSPTITNGLYKVQIGAYEQKQNADKMLVQAKSKGFKDAFIVLEGKLYKVQIGAYKEKANADAQLAKAKALKFQTYLVTPTTSPSTTHISKSGTWKFNTAVKIRSTPSTSSGDTGLIYTSGMTVNIASTQVADGYIWGKYTSTSGQTRYVALQKVNGIAYGKWV